MDLLGRDVFNGTVWPDFSGIVSPLTNKPAVLYRPLTYGKRVMFNDIGLTAVPVDHQIPASSVIGAMNGQAIAFTADTGPPQELWKPTTKTADVVAVETEG